MGQRWVAGPFVYVSGVKAMELEANLAHSSDIVFTQRGTLGQVSMIADTQQDTYLISQSQMKLTVNRDLADPLYVYYVFTSARQRDYFKRHAIQTGVPHTNLGTLRATPLSLPSLGHQRAIARILGSFDDKIELNRRMSETLEEMAQALFKSWFVDFDPVRAKAEGRNPGIPGPLADLFPSGFADSDRGEIPEGWKPATLADVAVLNPESWSKATRPSTMKYVDLSNTKWGRIESGPVLAASDAPSRAQRVLRPGDTIIGTVRPGNGSYALISDIGLTGSTGFAVLRPRSESYREFVYLTATSTDSISSLAQLADGGAYPAVRPDVVASTPLVRPPDTVLDRFSRAARPMLDGAHHYDRESETLARIRDALLPKLITGELQVPVEREREEVL
jgi:type I restriction enzyme S subunit